MTGDIAAAASNHFGLNTFSIQLLIKGHLMELNLQAVLSTVNCFLGCKEIGRPSEEA